MPLPGHTRPRLFDGNAVHGGPPRWAAGGSPGKSRTDAQVFGNGRHQGLKAFKPDQEIIPLRPSHCPAAGTHPWRFTPSLTELWFMPFLRHGPAPMGDRPKDHFAITNSADLRAAHRAEVRFAGFEGQIRVGDRVHDGWKDAALRSLTAGLRGR
jgi:hypothetical protein